MHLKRKYRKTIAAALLALFVFCSVPKYFLHNIFANHAHGASVKKADAKNNTTTIDSKANCDCEDLYTDIYFTENNNLYTFKKFFFNTVNEQIICSQLNSWSCQLNLRGPPAC